MGRRRQEEARSGRSQAECKEDMIQEHEDPWKACHEGVLRRKGNEEHTTRSRTYERTQ